MYSTEMSQEACGTVIFFKGKRIGSSGYGVSPESVIHKHAQGLKLDKMNKFIDKQLRKDNEPSES